VTPIMTFKVGWPEGNLVDGQTCEFNGEDLWADMVTGMTR